MAFEPLFIPQWYWELVERINMSKLEDFHASVGTEVQPSIPRLQPKVVLKDVAKSSQAWSVSGDGDKFAPISESRPTLDPGTYEPGITQEGMVYFRKMPVRTDTLMVLPDTKSESIIKEIQTFATLKPQFEKRGLLFKRGILLWGPPGSGKTVTIQLLARMIVDELKGIALMVENPAIAAEALKVLRKIEPQRQIIGLLEDVDTLIEAYGPSQFLALLDGEHQVDNIVFVATTNYPQRLDKRFVDRPSRFDTIEYIGFPNAAAREVFLRAKEPDLPDEVIAEMVEKSNDLSIAHLRELIISTQCFGRTVDDTIQRFTAARRRPPNSEKAPDRPDTGFLGRSK